MGGISEETEKSHSVKVQHVVLQKQEEECASQQQEEQDVLVTTRQQLQLQLQEQEQQQGQQQFEEQQEPVSAIKKDFGYELVVKQLYNPLTLQALYGDVFVDLNIDYENSQLFGQPSLMNQYKQVHSIESFDELGLIEVNLLSNYTPIIEFQSLANILSFHSDSSLRALGSRLEKYQAHTKQSLSTFAAAKNSIATASFLSSDEFRDKLAASYKSLEKESRRQVCEVHKHHKLFFYSLRQINPNHFGFEIKKYGYSEDFLKLLGYSTEQYKSLLIRKGLMELQNFQGRIALNKMQLDLLLQVAETSSIRIKTAYITSDNLEIQVDGIVSQFISSATVPTDPIHFPCTEFLSVVSLDVQSDAIKKIYSIRGATIKPSKESLIKTQRLKEIQAASLPPPDEYYQMEAQILLEKFYLKNSPKRKEIIHANHHILKDKTCGFRYIKQLSQPEMMQEDQNDHENDNVDSQGSGGGV